MNRYWLGSVAVVLGTVGMAFGQSAPSELPVSGGPPFEGAPVLPKAGPAPAAAPQAPQALQAPSTLPAPPPVEGPGCGGSSCPVCDVCDLFTAPACKPAAEHFWFGAEYLLWWIKDSKTPPLVTVGPPGGPGQPPPQVLIGGDIDNEERSGARFTGGIWLTDTHLVGLDAGVFFLAKRSVDFFASSPGDPILGRPYFNARTGAPATSLTSFPGIVSGSDAVSMSSRLWGYDTNLRSELLHGDGYRLSVLAGYRYLELSEQLSFTEVSTADPSLPVFGGTTVGSVDSFAARNYFYGGQIGMEGEICVGRLSLLLLSKVAFGSTHEIVNVDGTTSLRSALGPTLTLPSGVLALPSNMGRYSRDEFAVLPEAGVTLGVQVTSWLRATVGYSFLYLSDVIRPGQAIDPVLNTTQVPPPLGPGSLVGPSRPAFEFHSTDFWAQGINFGLQVRF